MASNLDLLRGAGIIPKDYGSSPAWQLVKPEDRPKPTPQFTPNPYLGSGGGGGGSYSGGGGGGSSNFTGTQVSPELQKQVTQSQNKTAPDNTKLLEQQKKVAIQNLSYQQFIQDKNPVSGSLLYAGERLKAMTNEKPTYSRIPETRRITITPRPLPDAPAPIRNPTFSEFATNIGTAGLFFVPYLGEGLLVASAAGSLTKGGQKEIAAQSQQTGIPAPVLQTLSLFGGALGGASLVARGSKLLGYPKYEVGFLSQAQQSNENLISSQTAALIRQKNLLSGRQFLGVSKDITQFEGNENVLFKGAGVSASREIFTEFPTGRLLAGQPKTASTIFYGQANVGDIELTGQAIKGLTPSTTQEGFTFVAASGSRTAKGNLYSAGAGAGFKLDENNLLTGSLFKPVKNNRLLKYGNVKSRGLVRIQEQEARESVGTLFLKSEKKLTKSQVQKEIVKQQVQQSLIASIPKAQNKNVGAFGLITSTRNKPMTSQSLFYGTGQYEKTETSPIFNSNVAMTSGTSQKNPLVNIAGLAQPEKQKESFGLILPSGLVSKQRQPQDFIFNQRLGQPQRQTQPPRYKTPFGSSTFMNPFFPKQTKTPPLFIKTNDESDYKKEYGFIPFVKSKGRWSPVSGLTSRGRAFSIASGIVDRTLSRSFAVVRSNKKIKATPQFSGFSLSNRFRPSKKNSAVFVERSKFALGRTGELSSIQRARRSHSKTKLFTSRLF